MSEIIKSQVAEAKKSIKEITNHSISDDRAFSYLLLHYVFGHEYNDIVKDELVTDGNNDGGIDFVSFDEDESKVIVCQSKYTGELTYEQIITELSKMYRTIQDFKDPPDTGRYNVTLKKTLQNALDRLTDDNIDNIEYCIFTTAAIDSNTAMKKINKAQLEISADAVMIYTEEEIEKEIQSALTQLPTVKSESIKLDQANNYLQYKSDDMSGIQCNVSSSSIIQLYNKHGGKGLFDLNIRRYIRNKLVDTGVNRTLDNDRKNFWFLNNGIIIACKDFFVDGNTVKLTDFSIVNGGQTTHLIGT